MAKNENYITRGVQNENDIAQEIQNETRTPKTLTISSPGISTFNDGITKGFNMSNVRNETFILNLIAENGNKFDLLNDIKQISNHSEF